MELVGLLLFAVSYFFPSIIAFIRGHLSSVAIAVFNLLLGWTIFGWIAALVWAFTGNTKENAQKYMTKL